MSRVVGLGPWNREGSLCPAVWCWGLRTGKGGLSLQGAQIKTFSTILATQTLPGEANLETPTV